MTLEQFDDLDEMEQRETLWENGEFVADRIDDSGVYRVALYQIFSFYIEVFYYIQNYVIKEIIAFNDYEKLDVYLEQYNFDELKSQ
jgi:hypothetical protein